MKSLPFYILSFYYLCCLPMVSTAQDSLIQALRLSTNLPTLKLPQGIDDISRLSTSLPTLKLPQGVGGVSNLKGVLSTYAGINHLKGRAKIQLDKILPASKIEQFMNLGAGVALTPSAFDTQNLSASKWVGSSAELSSAWLKGIVGVQVQGAVNRFEDFNTNTRGGANLPFNLSSNTQLPGLLQPNILKELSLMAGPIVAIPISTDFKWGAFAQGGISAIETQAQSITKNALSNTNIPTQIFAQMANPSTMQTQPTWKVGSSLAWQQKKVAITATFAVQRFAGANILNTTNVSEFPAPTTLPIQNPQLAYSATIGISYKLTQDDKPKKDSTKTPQLIYYFEPQLTYPIVSTTVVKDTLDLAFMNNYSGGTNYTFSFKPYSAEKSAPPKTFHLKGLQRNGTTILAMPLAAYQIKQGNTYLLTLMDNKKTFYFLFYYQPENNTLKNRNKNLK